MRGSPLFRALLTLAALLLAAWPVWRITRSSATPIPAAAASPELRAPNAARPQLALEFLPAPPIEFEVKYLGKTIWRGSGNSLAVVSPPLDFTIPAEGVDLQITARWPADLKHGAVRARLTPSDGVAIERLAWTREGAMLDDVLTFTDR